MTRRQGAIPAYIDSSDARGVFTFLEHVWVNQIHTARLSPAVRATVLEGVDDISTEGLRRDLDILRIWFDPLASGSRLRKELELVEPTPQLDAIPFPTLYFEIGPSRWLLTAEGRALLWLARRAGLTKEAVSTIRAGRDFLADLMDLDLAHDEVLRFYKELSVKRIGDVVGLLNSETATLRPSAAGLLLVLLLNRNTSFERRLPSPADAQSSEAVSRAISSPAVAFALALSERTAASERGVDLYRGWALGEIARRLGSGLHRESGGVWIDDGAVPIALSRLKDSLADRAKSGPDRVHRALDAAVAEYTSVRPILSGFGLAFERPDNTRSIVDSLRGAIDGVSAVDGSWGHR